MRGRRRDELHVGSFSIASGAAAGTFAEAQTKLADLADLGVTVVELMPIQDFGGKPGGWGYNPQLYLAPKPAYGSAAELRAFVDEAHARGIAVWLDTVVNHYDGFSKAPLACFDGDCFAGSHGIYFFAPGPYATTPWGPRPDYTAKEVAAMLRASVSWWLDENHGDGFRWDSVSNVRAVDGKGTTPGGQDTDWQAYGADLGGGQTGTLAALTQAKDGKPYALPVKLGAYSAVVLSR